MEFIDTHCHLSDEHLPLAAADAVARAKQAGVTQIIVPGTDLETSKQAVLLANSDDAIYAAVGMHPHDVVKAVFDPSALRPLIDESRVVAVGEIGMDFHHYDRDETLERQQSAFSAQLEFAIEAGLPAIVHGRKAYADVLDVMRAYPESLGVLHSFEADYETARAALDAGWLISLTALVTYLEYDWLRDVVRRLPLELLMLETDAPYLPPQSVRTGHAEAKRGAHGARGQSNEPKYVVEVAKVLAGLKGVSLEEVAAVTTETARNFFHLTT